MLLQQNTAIKKLESVNLSSCQVFDPFALWAKIKKNQGFIIFMAFLQFFKNVMKTFRDRLEISLLRLSEVKLVNQFYSPKPSEKHGLTDDFKENWGKISLILQVKLGTIPQEAFITFFEVLLSHVKKIEPKFFFMFKK